MAHSGIIVHMHTDPDDWKARILDKSLPSKNYDGSDGAVPVGFRSDGSSVPWIAKGIISRHAHPIAYFRHDYRCRNAKSWQERLWADREYEKDVGRTSWWITKKLGYAGTTIGSIFARHKYKEK